jgi:GDPmannose 4,6-dehydratase
MRRALVTGISGQDGSYLAELLLAEGYDVVGLLRPPLDRELPNLAALAGRVTLVAADLRDAECLGAAVSAAGAGEIYHLAAPTFVPSSHEDPQGTRDAILGATEAVLAAAGDARVFVASSSEVFGEAGVSPQDEDSPMRPVSPYGEAKLAAHRAVAAARERGAFAVSGIAYNHESVRRPERFLPRRVSVGVARIELGLDDHLQLGDLDAVRDWSAATDIVRAEWLALRHDEPMDYVLAGGVGRTVRDLVRTAFAHVGRDWEQYVRVDESLVRSARVTPLVGDPSRARRELGWAPSVSFEALIGELVDADVARLRDA